MSYPCDQLSVADVVHGNIYVPTELLPLLDSEPMQRLRCLKQLGAASLVFPSAEHSRFPHSLGYVNVVITRHSLSTMHLAGRMYDSLRANHKDATIVVEFSNWHRLAAMTAALLHDVGHGFYSHVFDNMYIRARCGIDWTVCDG